jgi:signal transduction histidine kinase
VQCIGLEATAGSVSANKVKLINPKLPPKEKSALAELARELLNRPEAATSLKATGRFELDSWGEQSSSRRRPIRLFFAHERLLTWDNIVDLPTFRLRGWTFASERPSTPFSPLLLRAVFDRLESTVRASFLPPSQATFSLALRGGALVAALRILAALYPQLSGLVLWQYDETKARYKSLCTFGTGKNPFDVPISKRHADGRRGLVSQILPDRNPVVYDSEDRSLWRPSTKDSWEPFDTALFKSQKWRSCIVIPIVSGGRLVGALSAYSSQSARVFSGVESQLAHDASLCAEAILGRRDQEVIDSLAARYDEELLTANVSLSALSLSHDILHYFRAVNKSVEEAKNTLAIRHLRDVGRHLGDIEKTMAYTEPAIAAMRRLATEARAPTKGPQVISDLPKVMKNLEQLLRSILPHFSESERLKPDGITVALEGTPKDVGAAELTFERIVVNLCVNAAQWKAKNVWVTGRFIPSTDEFHLVIRDDGKGIPVSIRDQVFDRFFTRRGGSGLGLYVVKSLVTQVDGEVFLQSYHRTDKVDQTGTAVTVVLPTVDQSPEA